MTPSELEQILIETHRYAGPVDGTKPTWLGPLVKAGILLALTDGPDTKLVDIDFHASGKRLSLEPAIIKAFWATESNGYSFTHGTVTILPERHRFSKLTAHKFDQSNPNLSYPRWGQLPYPATQDGRLDILIGMVSLDVDAGFAACSYGGPQIMGENYKVCGYDSPFRFAEAMARDECTQLKAFERFVISKGILPALRGHNWAVAAELYNGTGYRQNHYDEKLQANYQKYRGL